VADTSTGGSRALEFPPEGEPIDPSWWAPLEAVARTLASESRYRFFEADDFMLMAKVLRRPRPDVYLYKHAYIRRHLNLDAAGHAYRYIAPRTIRPGYEGRYVLHRDVRTALDTSICGSCHG